MKTPDAPNLLDRAKQKIKRLEDALEQAEAEVESLKHWQELAFVAYPNIDLDIEAVEDE